MWSRAEQVKEEAPRSGIRSLSFSKLFSFRTATSSTAMNIDQLAAEDACAEQPKRQQSKLVCRSQSMPMTSSRRFPQCHRQRVADSSSLPRFWVSSMPVPLPESSPSEAQEGAKQEEDEEEVGEEEAVCRICMVALREGGSSVLKLECHCKGELALAHRDCALKWFGIKGNANCDVCGHDVLNLPVTLRRVCDDAPPQLLLPSLAAAATPGNDNGGCSGFRRHGMAILVVVSMLAYFCFLEQLLVDDHGTAALAISLPFAGVLGLFSSLTITKMVSRRYVWIYSAVQFLSIVLFTHLFDRYVQLQAVIAIILSTFLGFSVAICANTVLQIIRWRARRLPLTADSHLQAAQP